MTKTRDGRFKEGRIKLYKEIQRELILGAKKHNQFTWGQLAQNLNVSTYTLRHGWLNGTVTLPISAAKKLTQLHHTLTFDELERKGEILNPFWGQSKGTRRGGTNLKRISKPPLNEDFAELYGIMLGDGCVYSNNSGICVTCDYLVDNDYVVNKIVPLIHKVFGCKPTLYYSKTERKVRCVLYSKQVCKFFRSYGFPSGKKNLKSPTIPAVFFNEDGLLSACLRGLYDTDGSISGHPNSKIMINFTSYSPTLLEAIYNGLKQLKVPVGKSKKQVQLYTAEKTKIFFDKVKSSNPKHIWKYEQFLERGSVPNSKELEGFLNYKKTN